MTTDPIWDLAEAACRLLEAIPGGEAFVEDWPTRSSLRETDPSRLPVMRVLRGLEKLTSPSTRTIVRRLIDAADRLAWRQTYSAEDFGAAFLDSYGWTELIGLRGPIASEQVACGFLLLGPATLYPSHAHEAEELYVPLAGTALWQRGEERWIPRRPGEAIHHPSWMTHATRTEAEPMLALYAWRGGDLAQKPRIIAA